MYNEICVNFYLARICMFWLLSLLLLLILFCFPRQIIPHAQALSDIDLFIPFSFHMSGNMFYGHVGYSWFMGKNRLFLKIISLLTFIKIYSFFILLHLLRRKKMKNRSLYTQVIKSL